MATERTVYHGTPYNFDKFDLSRTWSSNDQGWLGQGFYFTDNKELAQAYAGEDGFVKEAKLGMSNPFHWGDISSGSLGVRGLVKHNEKLPQEVHDEVIKRSGFIFKPGKSKDRNKSQDIEDEALLAKTLREVLISKGYDGVVADDMHSKEYVAFHADQIALVDVPHQKNKAELDRIAGGLSAKKTVVGDGKLPAVDWQEMLSMTDSEAFKNWFGDSQVVDEEGNAKKVFHGTRATFDSFSKDTAANAAKNRWSSFAGAGFFFADNPEVANQYAGYENNASIIPAYLSIRNPFDFQQTISDEDIKKIKTVAQSYPASKFKGDLWQKGFNENLFDALASDGIGADVWASLDEQLGEAHVNNILQLAGYDGIKHVAGDRAGNPRRGNSESFGHTYVAFEPTQIKSAIGNSGAFDPDDPRIHMADGGIVPGVGNGDTVPAMLEPGELVIPKDDVSKIIGDSPSVASSSTESDNLKELCNAIKENTSSIQTLIKAIEQQSNGSKRSGSSRTKETQIAPASGAQSTFNLLKQAVANSGNAMIGRVNGDSVSRDGPAVPGGVSQGAGATASGSSSSASAAAISAAARLAGS